MATDACDHDWQVTSAVFHPVRDRREIDGRWVAVESVGDHPSVIVVCPRCERWRGFEAVHEDAPDA